MKKVKSIFIFILVLTILLPLEVFADSDFKDIKPTDWHAETVTSLTKLGIISGYPDGTFRPNDLIKRSEFIKLLITSIGYNIEPGTGYWAEPYINKAIELELLIKRDLDEVQWWVSQIKKNYYEEYITREQMAALISRAALKTKEVHPNNNIHQYLIPIIEDYHTISDYHRQGVLDAYSLGLMGGYEDGTFRPKNNATRAEASTVIMRYLDESFRIYPNLELVENLDYIELKEKNPEAYWYDTWFLEDIKVYAPVREGKRYTEFIEIAQVLKDNIDKTKNFGVIRYVREVGNISASFYNVYNEKEFEEHVNRYPYYAGVDIMDISIFIKTIDWDASCEICHRKYPYDIRISNLNNYEKHSEVIEILFKELFEKDYDIAINELNNAIKSNLSGYLSGNISIELNNRKMVIENNSLNIIDIYVTPKLK